MPKHWVVTTSPENFRLTREQRFELQGFKSRHRRKAEAMGPGDRLAYYLTGAQAFAAAAEVTSESFEDHEPIWESKGKPQEDYPWRVPIRLLVALEEADWVPAEELLDRLEWVQKWPREHWHLAFQGNLREIGEDDFQVIQSALQSRERVA